MFAQLPAPPATAETRNGLTPFGRPSIVFCSAKVFAISLNPFSLKFVQMPLIDLDKRKEGKITSSGPSQFKSGKHKSPSPRFSKSPFKLLSQCSFSVFIFKY
jgi:hypothetical protein